MRSLIMKDWKSILQTTLLFFQKETAFAFVLWNVFLGIIYFLISDPIGIFKKNYRSADPFFPYKLSEIEKIQIGRNGHKTVLEKKNGVWMLQVREIFGRPDPEKISQFLNAIVNIRKFSKIEINSKLEEEYGLGFDKLELEIQTDDGENSKLDIGISGKYGNGTVVRDPHTSEIWLIEEDLNLLNGRGDETFFIAKTLFPEMTSIQEIHTILIESFENRNSKWELQQIQPEHWVDSAGRPNSCFGEECNSWISKILSHKAERILLKPFMEKILPLSSREGLKITIRFSKHENSILRVEWIGNTIQKEPIFRSDADSILYVMESKFLDRFRERMPLKEFFKESQDSF
ncbi:hypothetical protein AB3N59_10260 [Leptospira sp. WS92.C1]